jgi:hypothetical protein
LKSREGGDRDTDAKARVIAVVDSQVCLQSREKDREMYGYRVGRVLPTEQLEVNEANQMGGRV